MKAHNKLDRIPCVCETVLRFEEVQRLTDIEIDSLDNKRFNMYNGTIYIAAAYLSTTNRRERL